MELSEFAELSNLIQSCKQASINSGVRIENGYLILPVREGFEYTILMEALRRDDWLLDWIEHLAEKEWMTARMIGEMIALLRQL